MNARALAVALLLPIAAVLVASTAFAGSGERVSMAQLRGVNFVSSCTFSHRAADDPIVFFGTPGASHDHSFVGKPATNASSTPTSLLASGTTCQRPETRPPTGCRRCTGRAAGDAEPRPDLLPAQTRRHVEAFPPGFRMIAGDAKATGPQPLRHLLELRRRRRRRPLEHRPDVPGHERRALRLHVTFPSCWDGKNLDSTSHPSQWPTRSRPLPREVRPRAAPDLAHLPLSSDRRGDRDPRIGRPALRRTPTS